MACRRRRRLKKRASGKSRTACGSTCIFIAPIQRNEAYDERLGLFSVVVLLMASAVASAQEKKKVDPAFEPVKDDPKLPRVLLIGDSISINYTLPTRKLLAGKANVHRNPG